MRQIKNLRVISDDSDLLHVFSFRPEAIGSEHIMFGKKWKAIDNQSTTIVSFEPLPDEEDMPMASDKLIEIQDWLNHMKLELKNERISLSELSEIDRIHQITKEVE